nr:protein FAR1-RELATED SEQUENCE 5-like [Ipomoea batatas]
MRGGWESLLHPQPNLLYGVQLLVLPRLLPSKGLILPFQRLIVPRQRLIVACQRLILEVHASVESIHRMGMHLDLECAHGCPVMHLRILHVLGRIFEVLGFSLINLPSLPPLILCQYASTTASESKSLGKLRWCSCPNTVNFTEGMEWWLSSVAEKVAMNSYTTGANKHELLQVETTTSDATGRVSTAAEAGRVSTAAEAGRVSTAAEARRGCPISRAAAARRGDFGGGATEGDRRAEMARDGRARRGSGDFVSCDRRGVNMDSASGGCGESYSTDIGVEGSACDMEISPGMTKYWRPICANSLKPHVGQQFDSLDSAFGFYKQYAGSVGFDCRQSTTRKGRDGGAVGAKVGSIPALVIFPCPLLGFLGVVLMNFLVGLDLCSDFLRSFSCPRYLFNYFYFTSINIHFNSISFLSLLTITIFSGYSIDVIPTMVLLFLRHMGYPSMRPPLERMSGPVLPEL